MSAVNKMFRIFSDKSDGSKVVELGSVRGKLLVTPAREFLFNSCKIF